MSDSKNSSPVDLAAAAVLGLQPYVPGKPLDELEREYGIRNAVKLASNENPAGPADSVVHAMAKALTQVNRYPDGAAYYLKQKLAQHLHVNASQLTLGNGSNDILVLLAEAFLTPATNAVFSQYAFVVYPLAVQATGAAARVAEAFPADHVQPLGHDLDAMLAAIDEATRLVFIANPNNPTGSFVEPECLRAFLAQVPSSTVVVLDEAYCEYISDSAVSTSLGWLSEFPNLVITRTFSKIYGLAGLRVGYAISSAAIAELLNRIRQPFNINSVALAGAEAALDAQDHVVTARLNNAAGIKYLEASLAGLDGVRLLPSQGNFMLLEFPGSAANIYEALLQAGVIVRPVANYGLPNYLRVTVGTAVENTKFVAALNAVLQMGTA